MIEIIKPTLLLDKQKCIGNIDRIVNKANRSKVKLRPHFKTHQSIEIGKWFRERGVQSCTVSSFEMAAYFANDNWEDITVAFPLNYLQADIINNLAQKIKLNVLLTVPDVLPELLKKLKYGIGVFIEVDTGYHRTGIDPSDTKTLDKIIEEVESSSLTTLEGFLSHAGHTYKCREKSEVEAIHHHEVKLMNELRDKYKTQFPELKLSVGDTPSASMLESFSGVDEIRVGNLVFYDLVQQRVGSCTMDQIAVAMACPVVASNPHRNEIIIYGGGVHFSKDGLTLPGGEVSYGTVVRLNQEGWELPPTSMFVKSLSQEHGIIHAPSKMAETIKPGDVLGILPVHACLTADAMGGYVTLAGEKIERLN